MNETLNNHRMHGSGDFVDAMLSRHFRSEMPDPWPECEALALARRTAPRRRFFSLGRLALAASITLFFVGYLTLAGYFPRSQPSRQEGGPEIGSKTGLTPKVQTKHQP